MPKSIEIVFNAKMGLKFEKLENNKVFGL